MDYPGNTTPLAVTAVYTKSRIPRFMDNPLVEALPPVLDDEGLIDALNDLPAFDVAQRDWPAHERIQMIAELSDCMVTLVRHVQLAWALDTLMRQGYIGRAPRTISHTKMFQQLYEARKANQPFSARPKQNATAQLSSSLLGIPGQGKTSSLTRILNLYPQVIYHPELDFVQITWLHIEAPSDGISAKGLALSIIRNIDKLIPDGDYYARYGKTSFSAEALLNHAARLMHTHCVGMLVTDEIQNLKSAGTGMRRMMSLLVSASNELGVPILFVGTNGGARVLGLDASPARRSVGHAIPSWSALKASGDLAKPGEWEDFITAIWPFQWVKNATPLTQALSDLMFYYSQGIIDIALKLFSCVQWHCILDGDETITAQVIASVWETEFELVHPLMDAFRSGDSSALERYPDIAPLSFDQLRDNALNRYEGVRSRKGAVRPGHQKFVPTVTATLTAMGIEAELAQEIASSVEAEGKVKNLLDGTQAAIEKVKPPKAAKRTKARNVMKEPSNLSPDDYRNAISAAADGGTTVLAQLVSMGALCDLDALLELD
ncbi:AAA family ATPase [Paraburkholderia caribensis]|uniref:AAA family ATPase n=1 Tax=Paraburkholderia caribensis TaxID=75105 RepID=UPI0007C6FC52|nr:AAA family ATPase [Paraburkholderia caribensis]